MLPETKRPSRDEFYLQMAEHTASRATCNRLQVGCVIVKHNRVISTGYNGSPKGQKHCTEVGCLLKDGRCIRTIHAEANAVLHADRDDLEGATAYVSHEPCEHCTKYLGQMGIVRVVFRNAYPNPFNDHFIGRMKWVHKPSEEEVVPNDWMDSVNLLLGNDFVYEATTSSYILWRGESSKFIQARIKTDDLMNMTLEQLKDWLERHDVALEEGEY